MRALLLCVAASMVFAADPGVPLRLSPNDYAVQGQYRGVKVAAEVVPPKRVIAMFSPDISNRYIVVEVAIYPANGSTLDIEAGDFSLRVAQRVENAEKPSAVAPWPERDTTKRLPVDVTTEVGVVHESDNDAVNGHHSATATYTGVAVSSPARDIPPPPDPKVDPQYVSDRIQRFALPEGATKGALAGYLYFPQYGKRKKSDEIQLRYSKDAVAVDLFFPKQ